MTGEWDMDCMGAMGGMGGMAAMWMIGLLLLLVGAVVLTVVLVRAAVNRRPNQGGAAHEPGRGRGRQILEERYARGELSTEEYRERLRTLEENDL